MHITEPVTLLFEDEMTIRYQIQEILRLEKQFEEQGILDELEAYNPLIFNGRNFKVTMMIKYADEAERRVALTKLKGIEDKIGCRLTARKKVYAIADEDLERENETKTSAVHFVQFELGQEMAAALKYGVTVSMGVDHLNDAISTDIANDTRAALVADLK